MIGLLIEAYSNGPRELLARNVGRWKTSVKDIRNLLKLYDLRKAGSFILFMSFIDKGTLITVARPIAGREGDYVAGWIFIPSDTSASGNEVLRMVEDVKRAISADTIDERLLGSVLAKNYPDIDSNARFRPSPQNGRYAKWPNSGISLTQLLGPQRYQKAYDDYEAILLDDGTTPLPAASASVHQLSAPSFLQWFTVRLPHNLPAGATVTFDHRPMPEDMRVKSGVHTLTFRRRGFADVVCKVTIDREGQLLEAPSPRDWRVNVNLRVIPKTPPVNARIRINGREDVMDISEQDAKNAKITVSADGYKTLTMDNVDLTKGEPIYLDPEHYYTAQWSNGARVAINVEKRGELSQEEKNRIDSAFRVLNGGSSLGMGGGWNGGGSTPAPRGVNWPMLILGVILGGALTWGIMTIANKSSRAPMVAESAQGTTPQPDLPPEDQAAVDYLNSHAVWSRDELEQWNLTRGLWDDLNQFNLSVIKKKWDPKLSERSQRFRDLVVAVTKTEKNGWNPKQGTRKNGWCPVDVREIDVPAYIAWLSNDQRQPSTPQANPAQESQGTIHQDVPEHRSTVTREQQRELDRNAQERAGKRAQEQAARDKKKKDQGKSKPATQSAKQKPEKPSGSKPPKENKKNTPPKNDN